MIKENIYELLAVTTPTGAVTHQEKDFAALLEPKLRKVFYETYDEVPERYSKIMNVGKSTKAQETDYTLGAMSAWTQFGSGVANEITLGSYPTVGQGLQSAVTGATAMPTVAYQTIATGRTIVYTHNEFASGYMVERKYMDDEKYGIIEKMTKDLARAGRSKVETDAHNLINNAFSNTPGNSTVTFNTFATNAAAVVSGGIFKPKATDVEPLIGYHTLVQFPAMDVVGDNLESAKKICRNRLHVTDVQVFNAAATTTALSDASLKAMLVLGRRQRDEAGKLIQFDFDTLVVPPELEFQAKTLIQSSAVVGSANNDINALQGRLKIVVSEFLTSSTAWFVQDSKRNNLNFYWRVKPEFGKDKDFDSMVTKYTGYMRYSYGASDWRGILGADGLSTAFTV